jgi:hypothetical protein
MGFLLNGKNNTNFTTIYHIFPFFTTFVDNFLADFASVDKVFEVIY